MGYSSPFLAMADTTNQAIITPGTPQLVTFNTTILANKIVITSSSRFTFNEAGNYEIGVNFELNSTGANKTFDIWFRINGTDVTNSLSKNVLVSANDQKDIFHAYTISITAGQYVEVWINGDSANLSLVSAAAGVTPTRPVAPSIYLTIQKKPI